LKIVEESWALEQVQVFLGYASYQTTARFYAHLRSTDAPVPAPIRRRRSKAVFPSSAASHPLTGM
jgi:hypothetical protein